MKAYNDVLLIKKKRYHTVKQWLKMTALVVLGSKKSW